jgi:hypothetical protein
MKVRVQVLGLKTKNGRVLQLGEIVDLDEIPPLPHYFRDGILKAVEG